MAILNLSKGVYDLVKKDSYENRKTIVEQVQYYILLGRMFDKNPKGEFLQLSEEALSSAKDFKTTD